VAAAFGSVKLCGCIDNGPYCAVVFAKRHYKLVFKEKLNGAFGSN
jgi:hypothetical protein